MNKIILSILVALALALPLSLTPGATAAPQVATAAPSQVAAAAYPDRLIYHYPDDGYNAAFKLRCRDNSIHWILVGQSSSRWCDGPNTMVYVADGDKIVCLNSFRFWYTKFDLVGWHHLQYGEKLDCVHQKD